MLFSWFGITDAFLWRKAQPLWTCPHIHACSSRNVQINSPKRDRIPQAIQTTRDIPTLPECFRIPFGEIKIPAPMMVPTMMEIPLSRVTFFPSPTFLSSCGFPLGSLPIWANFCPSEATFPSLKVEEDMSIFCNTDCFQTKVSLKDDSTLVEEKLKSEKKEISQFFFLFLIVRHPSCHNPLRCFLVTSTCVSVPLSCVSVSPHVCIYRVLPSPSSESTLFSKTNCCSTDWGPTPIRGQGIIQPVSKQRNQFLLKIHIFKQLNFFFQTFNNFVFKPIFSCRAKMLQLV